MEGPETVIELSAVVRNSGPIALILLWGGGGGGGEGELKFSSTSRSINL